MVVIGWHLIIVAVAAMPVIVAVEMARDVAASRRSRVPLRTAVDAAVLKAAHAARWTFATLLAATGTGAGALLFAVGFLSVFPTGGKGHDNPLTLMVPGLFLVSIGFAVGCLVAPKAVRAIADLHGTVSAHVTPR